jgi:hypothetical protein
LAQLVGLSGHVVALIGSKSDPTARVLSQWRQGSLGILRSILGQLDRWDVVDDTEDMMSKRLSSYFSEDFEYEAAQM